MKNKVSAYNKSVEYLAQMAHTEFEMKRYLKKKYYEDAEISEALETLKDEGVIDDKKYAKDFIEFSIRNRLLGPNAIRVRLSRRGVSGGIISDTLSLYYPEELVKATALAAARKKLFDVASLSKQKKMEKVGRFLVSRGFPEGVVWETLSTLGLSE